LEGEWADPQIPIEGGNVVHEAKPGDVVAEADQDREATGFVGRVVAEKQTVSAGAAVGGRIVQSDG
jgi:hypothetical protein